MDGLLIKQNQNKHRVIRLHYSADVEKNPILEKGKKWRDEMANRYIGGVNSLGWRREMELDFGAGSGELVFPEFLDRESADIVIDPFEISETFTLYGGLDWGNRNHVAFNVYAIDESEDNYYSIWEYYKPGNETNVFRVAEMMHVQCPYYERLQSIYYDPSMNKEDQQRESLDDKTSIIRMFQEEVKEEYVVDKLVPASGRSDVAAIQLSRLILFGNDKSKLHIFKSCPNQINEFRNLKYPERKDYINESEKILDKNNHSWDTWKYFILSNPYTVKPEQKIKVGTLKYINKVTELAADLAQHSGRSLQEEFNEIYGENLTLV